MQQNCALGNAGGAAGVLQDRHIAGFDRYLLQGAAAAFSNGRVEAHRARQVVGGHHFLRVAHHVIDQGSFEQSQLVTHRAQNDVFDGRGSNAFLQRSSEIFQNDDGLGAGVFDLMLQLTGRVQGVDIHQGESCPKNGGNGNGVLQHVGHHDRHTVAFDQPEPLQVNPKRLAQAVNLGIGLLHAHEAVGRFGGEFLETLFHDFDHGRVLARVNVGGHTRRIAAEPNAICHLPISVIAIVCLRCR